MLAAVLAALLGVAVYCAAGCVLLTWEARGRWCAFGAFDAFGAFGGRVRFYVLAAARLLAARVG